MFDAGFGVGTISDATVEVVTISDAGIAVSEISDVKVAWTPPCRKEISKHKGGFLTWHY